MSDVCVGVRVRVGASAINILEAGSHLRAQNDDILSVQAGLQMA